MLVSNVVIHDVLLIDLAALDRPTSPFDICEFLKENKDYYDSIYPEQQVRPPGQLKIMMIYNDQMVVVNQAQEVHFLQMSHPFIQFCLYLQCDDFSKCIEQSQKLDKNLHALLAEMMISRNGMAYIYDLQLTIYERLAIELEFGKET